MQKNRPMKAIFIYDWTFWVHAEREAEGRPTLIRPSSNVFCCQNGRIWKGVHPCFTVASSLPDFDLILALPKAVKMAEKMWWIHLQIIFLRRGSFAGKNDTCHSCFSL